MTTKLLTCEAPGGTGAYLAIFDLDNDKVFDFDSEVLDWADTIGAATQPFLTGTEVENPGGSEDSVYKASLNLALFNTTATPKNIGFAWYSDTGLATPITDSVRFSVVSGDPSDERRTVHAAVTRKQNGDVLISARLQLFGQDIGFGEGETTPSCEVVCKETTAGVNAFTASSSTLVDDLYFNVTHALATPAAGEIYLFTVTITDDDGCEIVGTVGLPTG